MGRCKYENIRRPGHVYGSSYDQLCPTDGGKLCQEPLRPIPISTTLLLIQGGYPVDQVLRICIQGINGLDNRSGGIAAQSSNPEFYELLSLLGQIQQIDGIRIRTRFIDNRQTVTMYFEEPQTREAAKNLEKMIDLLGLEPNEREFRIVNGYLAESDREIAMMSRSMIQIMADYASYIDVPDSDIDEGRVYKADSVDGGTEIQFQPLIRVHCSDSMPDDAFIAVSYRNRWFFVDDRDIRSKRTFYFLMLMFSFTERSNNADARPVLTVPTN